MWVDKEELHRKQEEAVKRDIANGKLQVPGDYRKCICYYEESHWWERAYNWARKLFGLKPVVWW